MDKGGKVLIKTTDFGKYLDVIYEEKSSSKGSKKSATKN